MKKTSRDSQLKKQEQYSTQKRGFSEYLFTDGMTLQTSNNLSCLPKLSNPQSEQKINNIFLVEATLQFKLFVCPSVSQSVSLWGKREFLGSYSR